MKNSISSVVRELEALAPIAWQESYDNCGLQVGDPAVECSGVLVVLDPTEESIDEAVALGANLIVTHHPLLFHPPRSFTGKSAVERMLVKAVKHDVAIYSGHTNWDKYAQGVSYQLASRLGLQTLEILAPENPDFRKLVYFVPENDDPMVRQALFEAGAGEWGGYTECSFAVRGKGTFKPLEGSNPTLGTVGKREQVEELRVELLFPKQLQNRVVSALLKAHPYEVPAFDVLPVANGLSSYGLGMVGNLPEPLSEDEVLRLIKERTAAATVRHSRLTGRTVRRIALCGGSGGSLIQAAVASGADLYLTGELPYHLFDNYKKELLVCEIGHFESEQFIIEKICAVITEKFTTFAVNISKWGNPIGYF